MTTWCRNSPTFPFFPGGPGVTPCTVPRWRAMRDEYLRTPLGFVFAAFTCVLAHAKQAS